MYFLSFLFLHTSYDESGSLAYSWECEEEEEELEAGETKGSV